MPEARPVRSSVSPDSPAWRRARFSKGRTPKQPPRHGPDYIAGERPARYSLADLPTDCNGFPGDPRCRAGLPLRPETSGPRASQTAPGERAPRLPAEGAPHPVPPALRKVSRPARSRERSGQLAPPHLPLPGRLLDAPLQPSDREGRGVERLSSDGQHTTGNAVFPPAIARLSGRAVERPPRGARRASALRRRRSSPRSRATARHAQPLDLPLIEGALHGYPAGRGARRPVAGGVHEDEDRRAARHRGARGDPEAYRGRDHSGSAPSTAQDGRALAGRGQREPFVRDGRGGARNNRAASRQGEDRGGRCARRRSIPRARPRSLRCARRPRAQSGGRLPAPLARAE